MKKSSLDEIRKFHGGYWRYDFLDFYYLFNHYFPPPLFLQTLEKELPVLIDNYPSTQKVIAQLLPRWERKPYFNEDNLVVSNGSSELIRVLDKIITKITIPIPTFNEYVQLPEEKMNLLILKEESRFELEPDELIRTIKKTKSDFTVICNPNNPTGNVISRSEIEKILKTGVITIVDEAFIDLCEEYSAQDLVEHYENLIILKGLSKTLGVAGIRIGYLLTTNKKIKDKVKEYLPIWNINSIAERFIELFPEFKEDYRNSIKKTTQDREYLFQKLREIPYLEPYESHANFILCKTDIGSRNIAQTLFDKYNILIKCGLNQEVIKTDKYIRIGVRTKKDIDRLMPALKAI